MVSKYTKFLFYCFSIFFITIQGQNSNSDIDSLYNKSYDDFYDLFYSSKPDTIKATLYANAHFEKALREKDTMEMITGKYYLADIKNNENIYLNFCDSLIEIAKKYSSGNLEAKIRLQKIKFYSIIGNDSRAQKEIILANKSLTHYKKNDSLQNIIKIYTGFLKSKIDKKQESINLFKEAYQYGVKENLIEKVDVFSGLPTTLSSAYERLNKIDSADIFYEKSLQLYNKLNDEVLLGHAYVTKGKIESKRKNYQQALFYFQKAIPSIIDDEYYDLLMRTYSFIGVASDSLKNPREALAYHIKADSLYRLTDIKNDIIEDSYEYLVKNAKENNSLKDQLTYTQNLIDIKEYNLKQKNKVTTTFINEYDIPKLVKEKENLQNRIQNQKNYKIVFIVLMIGFLALFIYQIKKKAFYKKQFEKIVSQKEALKDTQTIVKTPQKASLNISEEIINTILKNLIKFENNEDYLNTDINLQKLANTFNTNSRYLSKVINQHKNTSFSNYINQLRINYTVEKLKSDILLRKYTIKAIANEVGFKNVESFSKAFYKYTKLKPSYFIKELEKIEISSQF